jgi:hypothetical protein
VNRVARVPKKGVAAFRTQTGLCQHSNRSLFASANSAGKGFGVARDRGGIFGDTGQLRAVETEPSRVSHGKAAESQRLFRQRKPASKQLCVAMDEALRDAASEREAEHLMMA